MSEKTYYQRNKNVILNRAKNYYENDKDWESKQEINTELIWSKKSKKREYGENRHHNMSENIIKSQYNNKIVLIVYPVI